MPTSTFTFNCLLLDGVYRCKADGAPTFAELDVATDDELYALLPTLITRLMKLLTRRGVLVKDTGQSGLAEPDADGDEARTLQPLQAAAVPCRPRRAVRWRWQPTGLPTSQPTPAPRQAWKSARLFVARLGSVRRPLARARR